MPLSFLHFNIFFLSWLKTDFYGWHCVELCCLDLMAVVYGWILFCSTFCHHLLMASSGEVSLAVRWTVCLEWKHVILQRVGPPLLSLLLAMSVGLQLESRCWLLVDLCLDLYYCFLIGQCQGVQLGFTYQDFFTLRLSSFLMKSFYACEYLSLLDATGWDTSGHLIKPLVSSKWILWSEFARAC